MVNTSTVLLALTAIGVLMLPMSAWPQVAAPDLQLQQESSPKEDHRHSPDQSAAETQGTLRLIEPTPNAEARDAPHDYETRVDESDQLEEELDWSSSIPWGDTIPQWIMAVSGVVALIVSIWAVWLLKQTLRATRDATKEAERGATAAFAAIDLSRENMQLQLRPYLSTTPNLTLSFGGNRVPMVEVTVKNSGNTPAKEISYSIKGAFSRPGDQPVLSGEPQRGRDINPGQDAHVYWLGKKSLTHAEVSDFQNGKLVAYVSGEIYFRDVFGAPHF
ncbi:hypothetical protein [Oceanibacterium hippocampi]|uniref:Uncharacterized protein n=1 Tax=Oceanibacterium hippocampi TaxID=745714 RepID=A0A1Y5U454_9PROT|nr:hypothetical protein [Oceanibacterium hippocampi]SLN76832.1 hypothetical protein OCH7691_04205 [Oceanibacterium hippocampi]